jgi:hypothetical protein
MTGDPIPLVLTRYSNVDTNGPLEGLPVASGKHTGQLANLSNFVRTLDLEFHNLGGRSNGYAIEVFQNQMVANREPNRRGPSKVRNWESSESNHRPTGMAGEEPDKPAQL